MSKQRISFFVHNLSDNPIVRAAMLAKALQPVYEVEILGFILAGKQVYKPYRDLFEYKTIVCPDRIGVIWKNIPRLAEMATGDVVFACKPLMTSFGPAVAAARSGLRRPLLLDVEDDEWATSCKSRVDFVRRFLVKGWRHSTSWKYTRLLHTFTRRADGVTVVSRKLQRRYGGILVRHGPDENVFSPDRYPQHVIQTAKANFGLPIHGRQLAIFAGVPRPHKGWETLIGALTRPECESWDLVLAGDDSNEEFALAARILGNRCHRVGSVQQSRMADLIACADALPVPQKRLPFTESQVPAKMLEGMAMAKPVIATRVGDLPEILGEGVRGWLIEPGDGEGLARALTEIAVNPSEARRRGDAARAWFLREASGQAIREKLTQLITAALDATRN